MAYDWEDRYCVGIEEIDMQHKGFFDLLNQLLEKEGGTAPDTTEAQAKARFYAGLLKLRRYAFTHFVDEEEAMVKAGYFKFFAHKAEHDKFIRKMLDLEDRMKEKNVFAMKQITDFMAVWLTKHITGADIQFGNHIKNKGKQAG